MVKLNAYDVPNFFFLFFWKECVKYKNYILKKRAEKKEIRNCSNSNYKQFFFTFEIVLFFFACFFGKTENSNYVLKKSDHVARL